MNTLRLICILAGILFSGIAWSQEPDTTRSFKIEITNKRGKPVPNVVVQTLNTGHVGITDAAGGYLFPKVKDDEIIRIFLPKLGETDIPVSGLKSLRMVTNANKPPLYYHNDELINIGYSTISSSGNALPVNTLNAEKVMEDSSIRNLFDLIQGRIPGVEIGPNNSVRIRGNMSISASTHTEALVVVDNVAVGTMSQANEIVNVNDVKSIDVLKDPSVYGARGANGVIIITTKGSK